MKAFLSFLVLVSITMSITSQTVEGIYSNTWESKSGEAIHYELILNTDGTFLFNSTRTYLDSVPNVRLDAQGTWKLNGHLLVLSTTENSNKLTSQLNINKARYVNISTRNPKFNKVKPSFKFYVSDVFFAKDMELFKTESSITSSH